MGVDGDQDTWFSANFQYIVSKMLCFRGSAPDPAGGLTAPQTPSWETLGHTLAEGPTELRIPGPRDPTIRHCQGPDLSWPEGYCSDISFLFALTL